MESVSQKADVSSKQQRCVKCSVIVLILVNPAQSRKGIIIKMITEIAKLTVKASYGYCKRQLRIVQNVTGRHL